MIILVICGCVGLCHVDVRLGRPIFLIPFEVLFWAIRHSEPSNLLKIIFHINSSTVYCSVASQLISPSLVFFGSVPCIVL